MTSTPPSPAATLRADAARFDRLAEEGDTLADDLRSQATEAELRAQTLRTIAAHYRASAAVLDEHAEDIVAAQE